ncbi:hypothetical protein SKAU_G00026610 [Synaphobranchus kaupii]|uniref:Uncharacterized protein n=1 Tax=Synaphobranchus kaupii TaxID=118154 RepID=A0A9Q1JDN2_SYNKA|nr:hypothetical protein SKAU_G00026610 [Synaphobranchus kaupii]
MHGFPCAALQHCFGSPADVADSSPTPEDSAEDATAAAAVIAQPGPASKEQHTANCIPERAKKVLNVTNSNGHLAGYSNGDHTSQISISRHFEADFQDGSPDLGSSYPHIPRPSIIKRPKDSLLQEGLSEETDQTETEDRTLSGKGFDPVSLGGSSARRKTAALPWVWRTTTSCAEVKRLGTGWDPWESEETQRQRERLRSVPGSG